MHRRVVEEPPGAHEADRGAEDDEDADGDEGVARAETERTRIALELRAGLFARPRAGEQGEREQVELLDHEAEGDDGDPGAEPGKEGPLVGGVVGIVADHWLPPPMLEALKDYACRGGESKGEGLEPKCAACVPVLNGAADCLPPADRTPPHME